MAVGRVGRLFKINGQPVPDYAIRPVQTVGVQYGDAGATDLAGRPVGARGWPYIILRWERMSLRGLQWWESFIDESFNSAPVIDLTLPDRRGDRRIEGYLYHKTFTRGVLWRPVVEDGGDIKTYKAQGSRTKEEYIEGSVTIRITELGRLAR
jgi:hypothetical protein